jgi:hypothetical protein
MSKTSGARELRAQGDAPPAIDAGVESGRVGLTTVGGAEAGLDLLLAEDLAVDRRFARWFVRDAIRWRAGPDVPAEEPTEVIVCLNKVDEGPSLPPEAYGETDVDVTMAWGTDRRLAILIEDKVWALFQPTQPERYVTRAEVRNGVAVLVAPASYIAGHPVQSSLFHGCVAIEDIIGWLRSDDGTVDETSVRRRRWRADLLELLIAPRGRRLVVDDQPTVEFTQFCTDWFARYAPLVVASPASLHSAGQSWLWFESPRGLAYKASGWARKDHAAVDLYVSEHGFTGTAADLGALLAETGTPKGFVSDTDTAKPPNLVLRYRCAKVLPSEGAPGAGSSREAEVIDALEASSRAATWLQAAEPRLSGWAE